VTQHATAQPASQTALPAQLPLVLQSLQPLPLLPP